VLIWRDAGFDPNSGQLVAHAEPLRDERCGRDRGRDRADPDRGGEPAVHSVDVGKKRVAFGQNPLRPAQDARAFVGEPFESSLLPRVLRATRPNPSEGSPVVSRSNGLLKRHA
jgi:hypothetical protein